MVTSIVEVYDNEFGTVDRKAKIYVPFVLIAWVLKEKKFGVFYYFILLKAFQVYESSIERKPELYLDMRGFNTRTIQRYNKWLKESRWVNENGKPKNMDKIVSKLIFNNEVDNVKKLNNWKVEFNVKVILEMFVVENRDINKDNILLKMIYKITQYKHLSKDDKLKSETNQMIYLSDSLLGKFMMVEPSSARKYKNRLVNSPYFKDLIIINSSNDFKVRYGKGTDLITLKEYN